MKNSQRRSDKEIRETLRLCHGQMFFEAEDPPTQQDYARVANLWGRMQALLWMLGWDPAELPDPNSTLDAVRSELEAH